MISLKGSKPESPDLVHVMTSGHAMWARKWVGVGFCLVLPVQFYGRLIIGFEIAHRSAP